MASPREGISSFTFDFNSTVGTIWMDDCGGCDQVVSQVCNQGWRSYESPLPLLIARAISARPTAFFDVGANTGFYSLIAANAGAVQVRAFEPVPEIADIMAANLHHNYKDRLCSISMHRFALSDKNGSAELFIPKQRHGLVETSCSLNPGFRVHKSGSIEVNIYRLDDYLIRNPLPDDLSLILKLDVESHEPQVLQGSEDMLNQIRPIIFSEIFPGDELSFYYKWMEKHSYDHFTLSSPNRVVPCLEIDPRLDQTNHLFVPKESDVRSCFGL